MFAVIPVATWLPALLARTPGQGGFGVQVGLVSAPQLAGEDWSIPQPVRDAGQLLRDTTAVLNKEKLNQLVEVSAATGHGSAAVPALFLSQPAPRQLPRHST